MTTLNNILVDSATEKLKSTLNISDAPKPLQPQQPSQAPQQPSQMEWQATKTQEVVATEKWSSPAGTPPGLPTNENQFNRRHDTYRGPQAPQNQSQSSAPSQQNPGFRGGRPGPGPVSQSSYHQNGSGEYYHLLFGLACVILNGFYLIGRFSSNTDSSNAGGNGSMSSAPPPFFKNNERFYNQSQNGNYKSDINSGSMGYRGNAYKSRNDANGAGAGSGGNMMMRSGNMPSSNNGPSDFRGQGPRPANSSRSVGPSSNTAQPRPQRTGTGGMGGAVYGGQGHRGSSNRSQQAINT
jgi:hypothetical protein